MTAAEWLEARREDLRLARIDLRNAAARYGALTNGRVTTRAAFEEAADALDNASRRFTNAELDYWKADAVARAEELAREAKATEEQARRARRSHLCVIDGGG